MFPSKIKPRLAPRGRFVLLTARLGLGLVTAAVLYVVGCGARSELTMPGAGAGGAAGCTETQVAAVSASIGGGIHHVYTECLARPDGGACPSADAALGLLEPQNCPSIEEIECGPIEEPEQCCYVALELCAYT
jgi:hypothetical protein